MPCAKAARQPCALLAPALGRPAPRRRRGRRAASRRSASAQDEAGAIAAELRAAQDELAGRREEAAAAAAREEELSGLLADGEQRAAELAREVERSERRLARGEAAACAAPARALAERLVAIYESGSPTRRASSSAPPTSRSSTPRADYLERIEEADTALAARVEQVRDAVRRQLSGSPS